jgi:hypothetical protein
VGRSSRWRSSIKMHQGWALSVRVGLGSAWSNSKGAKRSAPHRHAIKAAGARRLFLSPWARPVRTRPPARRQALTLPAARHGQSRRTATFARRNSSPVAACRWGVRTTVSEKKLVRYASIDAHHGRWKYSTRRDVTCTERVQYTISSQLKPSV